MIIILFSAIMLLIILSYYFFFRKKKKIEIREIDISILFIFDRILEERLINQNKNLEFIPNSVFFNPKIQCFCSIFVFSVLHSYYIIQFSINSLSRKISYCIVIINSCLFTIYILIIAAQLIFNISFYIYLAFASFYLIFSVCEVLVPMQFSLLRIAFIIYLFVYFFNNVLRFLYFYDKTQPFQTCKMEITFFYITSIGQLIVSLLLFLDDIKNDIKCKPKKKIKNINEMTDDLYDGSSISS